MRPQQMTFDFTPRSPRFSVSRPPIIPAIARPPMGLVEFAETILGVAITPMQRQFLESRINMERMMRAGRGARSIPVSLEIYGDTARLWPVSCPEAEIDLS